MKTELTEWLDFQRQLVRDRVAKYVRSNLGGHAEAWRILYDRFVAGGGTLPTTKNKLRGFSSAELETLAAIAEMM